MSFRSPRFLSLGVLLSLSSGVLFGQDAPAQRIPEPAADAQAQSEKLIREVFKEEYAKRSISDQKALARKLIRQGTEIRDDPTARYVLFREAREIAEKSGDLETAMAAIAETAKVYEIDGTALKAKTLIEMAAGTKSPEAASALTDVCLEVIDEAMREEKFEVARSLVSKAESAAKAAKDASRTVRAQKKGKEIEDLAKDSLKAKEASKKLEANPADPEASLALGRYLFMKGDMGKALALLAKGSDPLLRAAAEKDLALGEKAEGQAAAGDTWWDMAEKEKNATLKSAIQCRAISCYEIALKGLTGIAKTRLEKRLIALGLKSPTLNLDLGDGVTMDLLYIKPGIFTMGGTEEQKEGWQRDERPPHQVEITRGFYLGKYEVTRGQFEAFVKATGHKSDAEREGNAWGRSAEGKWSEIDGANWWRPVSFTQTDGHPVVCVSWNDAKAFCEWAAKKTGRGVRLPTEAEWEYACRAATKMTWSFGDNESEIAQHGWSTKNSGMQTHPVGQRNMNAWGLYDMHGNVREWCQDWYGVYAGDARDPEGPSSGNERCLRGGSWYDHTLRCRSATRQASSSTYAFTYVGFRVALR